MLAYCPAGHSGEKWMEKIYENDLEHLQLILYSLLFISLDRGSFILFSFFIFQRTSTDFLSSILDRDSFIVSLEVKF